MKKWVIMIVNMLILAVGITLSVIYASHLQTERTEMAQDAFVSTVEAMVQVSKNHLKTQQEYVNNWGEYINQQDYTMEEALEFLRGINSSTDISAHIIDTETFEGYSTSENVLKTGDYSVSYANLGADRKAKMKSIADGNDRVNYLHITDAYANPLTGIPVVSFGKKISLKEENGETKEYLLLRLVPIQTLQDQWIFPTGYEEAEIGLISAAGEYIIRSDAMKSENFLEFIRAYNDLTYPQRDELEIQIKTSSSGILKYKNARGKNAYWVYADLGSDTDGWKIIGYVPVEELNTYGTDWSLIIMVCGVLLLILVVDGVYLLGMNKKLRESVEEAKQANQAKTRFLSTMSHDIRTPMNAIIGMTSIAMGHLEDSDRVQDCLKKITLASNHLLTLINDILDISKVESGQLNLNPMVFSLADTMTGLANIVRPQIGAKAQDFRIHVIGMRQEYLYADELRLNQIFINILSNAIKYTPTGGTITMTLEERLPDEAGKTVRLIYKVEDTGIGMTPEFAKTIFKPFTRAKDSRIDTIEGSGLGMAITKQMVDAMGGSITVESEPGKGSTFTVELELPAAEKMTDDLMLPPMRMLVADDDAVCLETTADMLRTLGVLADMADSGEKAVSMAVENHKQGKDYPIILLDWKMPGMDGVAAARAIREKVGKEVPIIILSAFDWSEIEEEALAAGVSGFISKPLFRSAVYEKIRELLHVEEAKPLPKEPEEESFRGMHLLVAEDNDMNWEITRELLGFYGITSDRAENGKICVEMLEKCTANTYAAVLMDIQMPVMNGRDAAREIRQSKKPYVREIPIIAMTADAFAEDIRACLDAGMNGHVAKPVDMKQLLVELKKVNEVGGKKNEE